MNLERNIPLMYTIGSLMWMRFFIPVLALFYIASQVSLQEFTIIMAVFSLVILLFEIPSGVLADVFGKKNTLLLGRAMFVVEVAMIAFFDGFWAFLIAKTISGIGVSLNSGSNSALLYETLQELGREKEHKKISGTLAMISNISMAVVFISGSFLFTIHHKLPAYVSLPLITFGFFLTFFLQEPNDNHKSKLFKDSFKYMKEAISLFKKSKVLRLIMISSVAIMASISVVLSMSSDYLAAVQVPVGLIGTVAFIGSLFMAYGSGKASVMEEIYGEKKSLYGSFFLIIFTLVLLSLTIPYLGAIAYLLIPLISGFFSVIINHYMNKQVNAGHRTTQLSLRNMVDNLGVVILFPIFGFLTTSYNYSYAFLLLLVTIIISLGLFHFYRIKHNISINS